MAEGNVSGELKKLRPVLGDITNKLGKRGYTERGTGVVKINSEDKRKSKRNCVLPRPCTEVHSLKENSLSGILGVSGEDEDIQSKNFTSRILKMSDEHREPNEEVHNISKSTIEVENELKDVCCEVNPARAKNWEVMSETRDSGLLVSSRGFAVTVSITETIDGVNTADSHHEIVSLKDNASSGMKKVSSRSEEINLTDVARGLHIGHIGIEAGECSGGVCEEGNSWKENGLLGTVKISSQKGDLDGAKAVNYVTTEADGCSKGGCVDVTSLSRDVVLGKSVLSSASRDPNLSDIVSGNAIYSSQIEADNEFRYNCTEELSSAVSHTKGEKGKASLDGNQSDIQVCQDDDHHYVDNFVLSQSGSVDCAVLPQSQESRVLGLETCTEPKKGEGCSDLSVGIDSIKACTCSLCTKAGYILLDLQYQDIKAQISALKKSQKEASILVERSCRSRLAERHGLGNPPGLSKLESELSVQWRALFQHMANMFEQEGSQLEAKLQSLTELRERCKTNLDPVNAIFLEKR